MTHGDTDLAEQGCFVDGEITHPFHRVANQAYLHIARRFHGASSITPALYLRQCLFIFVVTGDEVELASGRNSTLDRSCTPCIP